MKISRIARGVAGLWECIYPPPESTALPKPNIFFAAMSARAHSSTASTQRSRAEQLVALPSLSCALSSLPQAKSISNVAIHQSTLAHRNADSEAKVRSPPTYPLRPRLILRDSFRRRSPSHLATHRTAPRRCTLPYVSPLRLLRSPSLTRPRHLSLQTPKRDTSQPASPNCPSPPLMMRSVSTLYPRPTHRADFFPAQVHETAHVKRTRVASRSAPPAIAFARSRILPTYILPRQCRAAAAPSLAEPSRTFSPTLIADIHKRASPHRPPIDVPFHPSSFLYRSYRHHLFRGMSSIDNRDTTPMLCYAMHHAYTPPPPASVPSKKAKSRSKPPALLPRSSLPLPSHNHTYSKYNPHLSISPLSSSCLVQLFCISLSSSIHYP